MMERTSERDIGKLEARVDSLCAAIDRGNAMFKEIAGKLDLLSLQISNHLIYHQTSEKDEGKRRTQLSEQRDSDRTETSRFQLSVSRLNLVWAVLGMVSIAVLNHYWK
ncbi:MAG: hypothetical protein Q7O66_16615 [Dehalococcoidia bacterium]|nr:hypothetical protein [Dehalococcoidia bacterium]